MLFRQWAGGWNRAPGEFSRIVPLFFLKRRRLLYRKSKSHALVSDLRAGQPGLLSLGIFGRCLTALPPTWPDNALKRCVGIDANPPRQS